MKKYMLFIAAVALIVLAGCSSEENISVTSVPEPTTGQETSADAIAFSSVSKGVTRADHVGADAANLLNKHFTVGGFKVGTSATTVFDNYIVKWGENSAYTTESNSNDWEYVGIYVEKPSGIYVDGESKKQTIKYWDYMTSYYDFIGYSTGTATPVADATAAAITDNDHVGVIAIDYDNKGTAAYTIAGTREGLAKCYIADMVTVKKPDYQKVVQLSFRSLASKVRMAIYETVPGYSVENVKFYVDDTKSISEGATETEANLFTAGTTNNDYFFTKGTYTVYFPNTGSANESNSDYNIAHVSFADETGSSLTTQRFGALQYTTAEAYEDEGRTTPGEYLGRSLNKASFAANKDYKIMLPNEIGTVLELRIDYTLVSTDGSKEKINIYGAKALVPAIYTAWKPNYAYTYFFKISDNTNGWTSNLVNADGTTPTDPAGLYPITFDAAVVDTEEGKQSTITTVSMPTITTYQKGHVITKNEYDDSGDIYIQVMMDGALKPTNDASHPVQVWTVTGKANATEADVMDALNKRVESVGDVTTGRNGVILTKVETANDFTTIPGVDGNDIVITAGDAAKFTPVSGKTYAVTYKGKDKTNTTYYSAQSFVDGDTEPTDWATNWFVDPAGQTPVGSFGAGTYYKKYTDRNIDWGVKVIKVQ